MASNINVNNIITTFPIPGQDNSSQGFRDNFTNIQTNFNNAKAEIEDLQRKAVLKSALTDDLINNNMDGSLLIAADMIAIRETQVDFGTVSGVITLDFTRGHNHSVNTNGPITVAFTRMPPNGKVGRVRLRVRLNSLSHTITLPSSVQGGSQFLKGFNPITRKITFTNLDGLGTYIFEFSSDDQGATFNVQDLTRGTLPILLPASRTELGWVRIGDGISVTEEGLISANILPFASDTVPGLIKVGDKLSISNGVLSVKQDIGLITSGELNGRLGHITPNTGTFTNVTVGSDDTTVFLSDSLVRINGFEGMNPVIQMGNVNGYAIVHDLATDNFFINRDTPVGTGTLTALTISTTGNVGIGNTAPHSRLVVSGGGGTAVDIRDGGDINLKNADNSGSVNLYCDTDGQLNISHDLYIDRNLYAIGNVGVGTSSPLKTLDIYGSSFGIRNGNSYGMAPSFEATFPGTPVSTRLSFGSDNTGWQMRFAKNVSGTYTDYMTINDSGNVGIGRTDPTYTLDVNGTTRILGTSGADSLYVQQNAVPNPAITVIGQASTNNSRIRFVDRNQLTELSSIGDTGNGTLLLSTSGSDRIQISPTGNVSIGSTNGVSSSLRYFDVYNLDTGLPTSGADIRIITSDTAGTGNTSFDIVKRKNGAAQLINFETNTAAYIGFNVGTTERARVTSSGNVVAQNNFIDSLGNLRDIPIKTRASYTLILADSGRTISMTSGGLTVPSGVFTPGQTVTIYNSSSFSQTITQGSGVTMYQVGTANTGNRTLAQRGLASLVCVDTDTFVLTGGGLS